MSYEPFRGAAPPQASFPPQRENTSPNRRGGPPQSYEEFRATGKSIELTDATDTRGRLGAGPQSQYGFAPYPGSQPPERLPGYRIPGKSFWAKIRLLLRILSLVCSVVTGLLVGLVLKKYYETRNQRNANELFWPKSPKLQPTYYMIVAAAVTVLAHIGLIISHFVSRSLYYTEILTKRDKIGMWVQFLLAITWFIGGFLARLYTSDKYGDKNDLWSWTCTEAWHQRTVVVNFAVLCGQLSAAYYVAYLNGFLELLSLLTFSLNSFFAKRSGYQPGYH